MIDRWMDDRWIIDDRWIDKNPEFSPLSGYILGLTSQTQYCYIKPKFSCRISVCCVYRLCGLFYLR